MKGSVLTWTIVHANNGEDMGPIWRYLGLYPAGLQRERFKSCWKAYKPEIWHSHLKNRKDNLQRSAFAHHAFLIQHAQGCGCLLDIKSSDTQNHSRMFGDARFRTPDKFYCLNRLLSYFALFFFKSTSVFNVACMMQLEINPLEWGMFWQKYTYRTDKAP